MVLQLPHDQPSPNAKPLATLKRHECRAPSRRRLRLLSLRHMRGPGLAGFRLDVREAHARRWIGNADEMLAGGALNLPAGEMRLAA